MRLTRALAFVAVAIITLSLGLAGVKAATALRAQPTTVAVVDLAKVFESLREQQQVKADLLQKQEGLKANLGEKKKAIDAMQGDLDLLQPGSAPYAQKQADMQKAAIEYQVMQEFEVRKLRTEEQVQIEGLIRKVNAAIERVSKEAGYDLVLYKNQTVNMRTGDNQNAQIQIRMVAYNAETIELTDQLIQRMNNEFQAGAQ